jgi:hypothetical protein
MAWTLEARFRTPENEAIVAFITRHPDLSAHDDVAEALTRSARHLPDVRRYCPDLHAYAYFVLHTGDSRIFGIAFGQDAIAYRLPETAIPQAIAEGATIAVDIGNDWMLWDAWGTTSATTLERWCKIAHDHAVSTSRRSPPP